MNQQQVIITTKNAVSLTLGIIAIVLAVLALLVGWIPYLGLIAIPFAVIALLLAGIGLLAAIAKAGKGVAMPLLGGLLGTISLAVPIMSTGGTTAAIGTAIDEANRQTRAIKAQELDATQVYIDQQLQLYDIEAKYTESLLGGRIPGLTLKIKNNGDGELKTVRLIAYFYDKAGSIIAEDTFLAISPFSFSSGRNRSIRPGYIWQMERVTFWPAKSVPDEWNEGSVKVEVAEIEFTD